MRYIVKVSAIEESEEDNTSLGSHEVVCNSWEDVVDHLRKLDNVLDVIIKSEA